MSKIKAIGHYTIAAIKGVGLIGTVTGTGTIHVVARAMKMRLPGAYIKIAAKYQVESLNKSMKKAKEEWNKV